MDGWKKFRLIDFLEEVKGSAALKDDQLYELWSVPSHSQGAPEIVKGREIKSAKRPVLNGDVLLCKINPRINRVWVVDSDWTDEKVASTEWITLRPKRENIVSARWLQYYFSAPKFREWINSEISGATGSHTRAKPKEVMKQSLFLPTIPEQKRIVAILDEAFAAIDTAIANTEKNLANARELFESYLNQAFTPSSEGWIEKRLSQICDIKHGFAFKGDDFAKSDDVTKPIVITPGNFTEAAELRFSDKNTKRFFGEIPKDFLFDEGDLVIVMTDLSSKMKILGKPAFIEEDNILHNQRIGRVLFHDSSVSKRFLYYFLQTKSFLDSIKESATGTMVKHTAPKRILSSVIPFPQILSVQESTIDSLDTLGHETRRLERIAQQKLDNLCQLRKSVLRLAFDDEMTTQSAKDAVA